MNSEILDVLRQVFPVEPTIEEIIDSIEASLELFRTLQSADNDVDRSAKLNSVVGRLEATRDDLEKVVPSERLKRVAVLEPSIADGVKKLMHEWDISTSMAESVVNNLVQMSVDRILSGEENLKIWIGEGDARRKVELEHPTRTPSDVGDKKMPAMDPSIEDRALTSALLAAGVDRKDLDRVQAIIKGFVDDLDERSKETPSRDQSGRASRRRESEPSR